jgi:chaperonin cofactor prefoldin
MEETKILNEKIDKLQNHFTVYKTDITDLKETVKGLTSAIIGSQFNGHKGLLQYIDLQNQKIEALEKNQTRYEDNIKHIKYASGVGFTALVTGFFSFIIWIFTK